MPIKNFAIVPARSGSRRILNKNLQDICGKPLLYWTLKAATEAECIHKIFVSTDSYEYIKIIEGLIALYGFKNTYAIPRKAEHSTARSQLEEFILPLLQTNECSNVFILQPTSPVRLPDTIDNAYKHFRETKADSLVTTYEMKDFIWKDGKPNYNVDKRPRSQEYKSDLCFESGSVYITKYKTFLEHHNRLGGKIETFPLQPEEVFQIDDPLDFVICAAILKHIYKETI